MNRRRFLEILTQATVGTTIAYSFPSIIVPKNIILRPIDWTDNLVFRIIDNPDLNEFGFGGFVDAINKGARFSGTNGNIEMNFMGQGFKLYSNV